MLFRFKTYFNTLTLFRFFIYFEYVYFIYFMVCLNTQFRLAGRHLFKQLNAKVVTYKAFGRVNMLHVRLCHDEPTVRSEEARRRGRIYKEQSLMIQTGKHTRNRRLTLDARHRKTQGLSTQN